ncbi:MAG TPA: hypothetical protein VHN99_04445, partial [Deinococcales bacterium]|nr:hypothetical protein [Deinococcales bacterium]
MLEAVFWNGSASRHELSQATGFSKTKLNSLVGSLLDDAWLAESAPRESSGGRRPGGLGLNPGLGYLVGVDLGATSVDVVLADASLRVLGTTSASIDVRRGPGPVMAGVTRDIHALLAEAGAPASAILGIGVGVPGP